MNIVDLQPDDNETIGQVAQVLMDAFAHIPGFVKTRDDALDEIRQSFAPERISRVALDDNGEVLGWVGGISAYDGNVCELHPLAVKPSSQRRGVGRALVADLEEKARHRGALTVYLGTDDEFGGTTLFGADLYPDICAHLSTLSNLRDHPYEFYQKCGYVIVGLVPDANGYGKPDIMMSKRIGTTEGKEE